MIRAENISHAYETEIETRVTLRDVSFSVQPGEWVAILGRNGSGKSTLVRHLNGILPLQQGRLHVAGFDLADAKNVPAVRARCGMVFQNPENQFVSTHVGEDIAFGPENFGYPDEEVDRRVAAALDYVDMAWARERSPFELSGGQQQRIAIAGVLASDPEILIFDEATAMLDPDGRAEVLALIMKIHRERKKTILTVTHFMSEAIYADRVLIFDEGRLVADGSARDVLTNGSLVRSAGLRPPFAVRIREDLAKRNLVLPGNPLTIDELADSLATLRETKTTEVAHERTVD